MKPLLSIGDIGGRSRTLRAWRKDSLVYLDKTEPFDLNSKRIIWWKQGTAHQLDNNIPTMKHGMQVLFSGGDRETRIKERIEGRINAVKYREIFWGGCSRLHTTTDWDCEFSPSSMKTLQERLWESLWMSLSGPATAHNPTEHLWRDMKMVFHRCSSSNLIEIEKICQEEWEKLAKSRCAKLVKTSIRSCNCCQSCFYKVVNKGFECLSKGDIQFWLTHLGGPHTKNLFCNYGLFCVD